MAPPPEDLRAIRDLIVRALEETDRARWNKDRLMEVGDLCDRTITEIKYTLGVLHR